MLWNVSFGQSNLTKRLSFELDRQSRSAALMALAKKCDVDIAFSKKFFSNTNSLNISLQEASVAQILNAILEGTDVGYKELGKRILLFKLPYHTLSGYIEDESNGERLLAATIYCPKLKKWTETNEYGFFSISLPEGKHSLLFNYLGYEGQQLQYDWQADQRVRIRLKNTATFSEVLVTDEEEESTAFAGIGGSVSMLTHELVELSPSLAGVQDPIRTSTLLPGIQSGAEGLDGIFVRGGNHGQNLMLLDGAPVYIPYHLLGLFSIYNQHTINTATVFKGGFPARYGGRLSSVFDVRTRDGNQFEWSGSVGSNLVHADVSVEGPLFKEKGAILLSGRFAHSGFLLNPFFKRTYFRSDSEELVTNFRDMNAKLNYTITPNDRVYLSFYGGSDVMQGYNTIFEDDYIEESEIELSWSNYIGTLRWNHIYNNQLFSNITLTYSSFDYAYSILEEFLEEDEDEPLKELYYADLRSFNQDVGIIIDFDFWPTKQQKVKFGGGLARKAFAPNLTFYEEDEEKLEDLDELNIENIEETIESINLYATEGYLYVENEWNWNNALFLNMGLRLSSFWSENGQFANLEPRLSAQYRFSPQLQFNGSISRMVQYLHVVSLSNIRLPNDIWIPADEELLPESSWLTEVGFNYELTEGINLQLSAYLKNMNNLYSYKEGFIFEDGEFVDFLVGGTGQAKGIESNLLVKRPKLSGQLSYTLSEATRQSPDIADGKIIDHIRNQPHQVKLIASYALNNQLQLGLNWVYLSRGPIPEIKPLSTEQFDLEDEKEKSAIKPSDDLLFNDYHRLDLSLNYTLPSERLTHHFKLGASNIYNRSNLAYYRLDFNSEGEVNYQAVDGLGLRPMLSYRLEW